MNISNSMRIAITEIEGQLVKSDSIKTKLKKAMKLAKHHWLVVDEDQCFRCAIGAVLLGASDEEKIVLQQEMEMIKALSSAISGVPVDFGEVFEKFETEKFYGLIGMWKEIR